MIEDIILFAFILIFILFGLGGFLFISLKIRMERIEKQLKASGWDDQSSSLVRKDPGSRGVMGY